MCPLITAAVAPFLPVFCLLLMKVGKLLGFFFFFCMPKAAISSCEREGKRLESTGCAAEVWNKHGCNDP